MKVAGPLTIPDTARTVNVPELPATAWASGTNYALDATASIFGGINNTEAVVYQSLQPNNLNKNPVSEPTYWKAIGTTYLAHNSATAYLTDAVVTQSHRLWKAARNNTNKNPSTSPADWYDFGPTNPYAMFDETISTQTTSPDKLLSVIQTVGYSNFLGLFNIRGASVNVKVEENSILLHNKDYALLDESAVIDVYEYFTAPVVMKSDIVIDDLPDAIDGKITIEMTGGGAVSIGNVGIGKTFDMGPTLYPSSVGITNLSQFVENRFGQIFITKGKYTKNGRFKVAVSAFNHDAVYSYLVQFKDMPIMIVGSAEYASTIFYGIFRVWDLDIAYPTHSIFSGEVRSFS